MPIICPARPISRLKTGAKVGIGEHIRDVQRIFRPVFNATDVSGDGREFDHLFKDGERFTIGELEVEVIYTPGHTPACVSYKIGDAVFVGDTLFMPDYGTARADFPGGDARTLYRSIQRLLSICRRRRGCSCATTTRRPAATAMPGRRRSARSGPATSMSTTASARTNSSPCAQTRDATLAAPLLLLPSIQVNIRAGKFPPAEANGVHYLKVPVKLAS